MKDERKATGSTTASDAFPSSLPTIRTLGPKGSWIQSGSPSGFEWTLVHLPIANLPAELVGTRIIHITDIHSIGQWFDAYDVLIDAVRDAKPDMVFVTGDFVKAGRPIDSVVPCVKKLLAGLTARLGVFGVLGNHDRYGFAPHLADMNITMLDNQFLTVGRNGAAIELVGLPGTFREDLTDEWLTATTAAHPKRPTTPRLVLSHYPDQIRRTVALQPDVFFTGHTHGGQICLPGGWPLVRHDSLPRKMLCGVQRFDNTWLINNRGLGYTKVPLRLFCPNEVMEIVLERGKENDQ